MIKMLAKIQQFMYGRYGTDDLYKFLVVVYIIIAFINLFLKNNVLVFIEFVLLIITIYRTLSKKITFRRKENELYLKFIHFICKPFVNIKRNLQDRDHIYKRCSCGTTLKLPLPKTYGIKHARCPECKKRVGFLALKKEKIIIIPKDCEK